MAEQVRVGVYRRLDNRLEGLDDRSPRALELHNLRGAALHESLDMSRTWWFAIGRTRTTRSRTNSSRSSSSS